jgi:putative endopeptidase
LVLRRLVRFLILGIGLWLRAALGWAQVWRAKYHDAAMSRQLATNPHSPPEFRCNGVVRNLTEFYDAFGVKEGDKLWLPENRRVRIW